MTALAAITVGGPIEPWLNLGFAATDDAIVLANGALRFRPDAPTGLIGLAAPEISGSIEGIRVETGPVAAATGTHPNGAFELDHLVVMTDSLERTSGLVEAVLGLECRRIREAGSVRQAFHRFADAEGARGCILEVVERPGLTSTRLWGVVVNVTDVEALAAHEFVAEPRPAVQPGRLIAGVDKAAGHGVPLAFMSP